MPERMNFFIGEHPVGVFRCRGYPTSPGVYRYEPYRGTGHMMMANLLRKENEVTCWFTRRGKRFELAVTGEVLVAIPRRPYWVLAVAAVRRAG